jgi:hypothetical protein
MDRRGYPWHDAVRDLIPKSPRRSGMNSSWVWVFPPGSRGKGSSTESSVGVGSAPRCLMGSQSTRRCSSTYAWVWTGVVDASRA